MVSAKIESGRADGNQPGPEFHHKQRSGTLDEGRLRIIDHHLAEGEASDRDELQIGNRQGNTDDGDGLEESRDDMSDCQPDTGNENQIRFISAEPAPAPGIGTTRLPKGQIM